MIDLFKCDKKNLTEEELKKYKILKNSIFFDSKWYKKAYNVSGDPYLHYLTYGSDLRYNPSPNFSAIKYDLIYDDVRYKKENQVIHFENKGKYEHLFLWEETITAEDKKKINYAKRLQIENLPLEYDSELQELIVFLVPDVDMVGGGVMSINSIANIMKKNFKKNVIVCTVHSKRTFFKYSNFEANFNIYSFEQLPNYFKSLNNLVLHIPEIYVHHFLYFSTFEQFNWLEKIPNVKINILNQNANYMPRPRWVNYLKKYAKEVTITCAHKSYCTSQLRTSYDASVHLLSTSNMVKYKYVEFEKKQDLLVYSPDFHPMKQKILEEISRNFPNLKMLEIKNMKYKDYLDIIGKAKWMISFGEGLDGYFVESIRSGTIAFSVYNYTFFNNSYDGLENVYVDYNKMLENIVSDMNSLDKKNKYTQIVEKCIKIDKREYNDKEYIDNIKKYLDCDYTFPIKDCLDKRKELILKNPLISIVVATYNGERYIEKQIDSILNLDYKNIEIIVSDDNSTDNTLNILKKYKDNIKVFINNDHGLNSNFVNGIKHSKGDFIALCDQDDIWEANKLDVLLEHIDDFDLVFGNVCVIDKNDEYYKEKHMHDAYECSKTNFYHFSDYIKENTILGCTTLMRSSFVKKYLEIPDGFIYHDWWFVLNAIKNGNGIVFVDEQVIKYRQHGNNTALTTFNSSNWYYKKIIQDCMVRKYFELTYSEDKLLDTDLNYSILKNVFNKYIPSGTNEYFDNNYKYFLSGIKDDLVDMYAILDEANYQYFKDKYIQSSTNLISKNILDTDKSFAQDLDVSENVGIVKRRKMYYIARLIPKPIKKMLKRFISYLYHSYDHF